MDALSLLEKFSDPQFIKNLSIIKKIIGSLQVTLLGMAVTFLGLGILWGIIVIISKIINHHKEEESINIEDSADNEEIISVITAAIAASLNTSTHNIIVKDIVRIEDSTPIWGKIGRFEKMNRDFNR